MLKKILFSAFLLTMCHFISAQNCERNGVFGGGTVNGGVKLMTNKKGVMFIKMTPDFKTNEGPDLNIYLSNTAKVDQNSILVHSLDSFEAQQRYKVTQEVKMDEYKYVIIHCTKHNHHFGTAGLLNAEGEGCPVKN